MNAIVNTGRIAALQRFSRQRAADLYHRYELDDASRVEDLLQLALRAGDDVFTDETGASILDAIDALNAIGREVAPTGDEPLISNQALTLATPFDSKELALIAAAVLEAPSREGLRAIALRTVAGSTWNEIAADLASNTRSAKARARNAAAAISKAVTGRSRITGCGENATDLPKTIFGLYDESKPRECEAVEACVAHIETCEPCNELYIGLVRACEVIGALMPPLASDERDESPATETPEPGGAIAADLDSFDAHLEQPSVLVPIGASEAVEQPEPAFVADVVEDEVPVLADEREDACAADAGDVGIDLLADDVEAPADLAEPPVQDERDDAPTADHDKARVEVETEPVFYDWQSDVAVASDVDTDHAPTEAEVPRERPRAHKAADDEASAVKSPAPEIAMAASRAAAQPDFVRPRGVNDVHDPARAAQIDVPILAALPPLVVTYDDTPGLATVGDELSDRREQREKRKLAAAFAAAAVLLLCLVISLGDLVIPRQPNHSPIATVPALKSDTASERPKRKPARKRKHRRKSARPAPTNRYLPAVERAPRPVPAPAPAPVAAPAGDGRAEFLPEAG